MGQVGGDWEGPRHLEGLGKSQAQQWGPELMTLQHGEAARGEDDDPLSRWQGQWGQQAPQDQ